MSQHFTLEMANRMLPLVRNIVKDVLDHYRQWQQAVEAFEVAASLQRSGSAADGSEQLQRRAQELAGDIQGFLAELTSLGVEFKGFEHGLVDFPGELEGQRIMWCWKFGEASVQYWHDEQSGFAGRQPVEALLASRDT